MIRECKYHIRTDHSRPTEWILFFPVVFQMHRINDALQVNYVQKRKIDEANIQVAVGIEISLARNTIYGFFWK